jgi:hypothetical protein
MFTMHFIYVFSSGIHAWSIFLTADYDLTGQMIWPGAEHLNHFLAQHPDSFKGFSVLELGSGVGENNPLILLGHLDDNN